MKNRILIAILPVLACFGLLPGARAQCLDGCDSTNFNTFQGDGALITNTTGGINTAIGAEALSSNTTGFNNIALGFAAGDSLTTGDDNIDIGNEGVAADVGTIRIGTTGTQMNAYVAGISGATVPT